MSRAFLGTKLFKDYGEWVYGMGEGARLKIIGTSHIARESVSRVEVVLRKELPQVVAVELDRKRLFALVHGDRSGPSVRDIKRIGLKGWLFALVGGWVERKLGAKVGVFPGEEMLRAVSVGREVGAKVALIDQDIEVTLRRFSQGLSWREKGRFVQDVIGGFFGKGLTIDVSKVPPKELIAKLLEEVKGRYPNVYRVLVVERNEFMAHRLAELLDVHPDQLIVAVVGAGHEGEIARLVKKYLKAQEDKEKKKRFDESSKLS